MKNSRAYGHPYIPNSSPAVRRAMMDEIGIESIDELYEAIPPNLRLESPLDVPEPIVSEARLLRHMEGLIEKNTPAGECLSFLGGGCWQHYVPAVCDEINQRAEFLTAYSGITYTDHGKCQAFFEYASLMGELLEMDAVTHPTFDWASALGTSLRMATRITDRPEVLLPSTLARQKLEIVRGYCEPDVHIRLIPTDERSGQLDLDWLAREISSDTAAVYVENPAYLGYLETRAPDIAVLAHDHGALSVVGVDPVSLGVLAPPVRYGADIVCGELQPFGMHMGYGGGMAGFIATSDDERYIVEYPTWLYGITDTGIDGEHGFGYVRFDRTTYIKREEGKEFGATTTGLWAITAAVYMSLLGPDGLRELGQGIMQRAQYAAELLNEIDGVEAPGVDAPFFKEFVVRFRSGDVRKINRRLREEHRIFGGHDVGCEFPQLGAAALYCVTELHTRDDINRVAAALSNVLCGSDDRGL